MLASRVNILRLDLIAYANLPPKYNLLPKKIPMITSPQQILILNTASAYGGSHWRASYFTSKTHPPSPLQVSSVLIDIRLSVDSPGRGIVVSALRHYQNGNIPLYKLFNLQLDIHGVFPTH